MTEFKQGDRVVAVGTVATDQTDSSTQVVLDGFGPNTWWMPKAALSPLPASGDLAVELERLAEEVDEFIHDHQSLLRVVIGRESGELIRDRIPALLAAAQPRIGTPISREEALRSAHETMERAEAERLPSDDAPKPRHPTAADVGKRVRVDADNNYHTMKPGDTAKIRRVDGDTFWVTPEQPREFAIEEYAYHARELTLLPDDAPAALWEPDGWIASSEGDYGSDIHTSEQDALDHAKQIVANGKPTAFVYALKLVAGVKAERNVIVERISNE